MNPFKQQRSRSRGPVGSPSPTDTGASIGTPEAATTVTLTETGPITGTGVLMTPTVSLSLSDATVYPSAENGWTSAVFAQASATTTEELLLTVESSDPRVRAQIDGSPTMRDGSIQRIYLTVDPGTDFQGQLIPVTVTLQGSSAGRARRIVNVTNGTTAGTGTGTGTGGDAVMNLELNVTQLAFSGTEGGSGSFLAKATGSTTANFRLTTSSSDPRVAAVVDGSSTLRSNEARSIVVTVPAGADLGATGATITVSLSDTTGRLVQRTVTVITSSASGTGGGGTGGGADGIPTGAVRGRAVVLIATPPRDGLTVTIDGTRLSTMPDPMGKIVGSFRSPFALVALREVPAGAHEIVVGGTVNGTPVAKTFRGTFLESVEWDGHRFDETAGTWPDGLNIGVLYFEDISVSLSPESATASNAAPISQVYNVVTGQLGGPSPFDVRLAVRGDFAAHHVVATFANALVQGGQSTALTLAAPQGEPPARVPFQVVAQATGGGRGSFAIPYEAVADGVLEISSPVTGGGTGGGTGTGGTGGGTEGGEGGGTEGGEGGAGDDQGAARPSPLLLVGALALGGGALWLWMRREKKDAPRSNPSRRRRALR